MKNIKSLPYFVFTIVLAVLISAPVESIAGVMPIPIFSGNGIMSDNVGIALLIALNIPLVLTYFIRSTIWIFKHKSWPKHNSYSFSEYVLWDGDLYTSTATTVSFVIINGIALIIWLAITIEKLL